MEAPMIPQFPADLSTLSDEQLAELIAAAGRYGQEALAAAQASGEPPSAETIAELTALRAERDRALAHQAERTTAAAAEAAAAEQRAADLAALQQAFTPPAAPPGDIPAEPAGGGPAAAQPPPAAEPTGLAVATGITHDPALAASLESLATAVQALSASSAPAPAGLPPLPGGEPAPPPATGNWTIVAAADVPGLATDQAMPDLAAVAAAMVRRRDRFGSVPAGVSEKVTVASITAGLSADRHLSGNDDMAANLAKINSVLGLESIVAAGGLCAPVTAYYPVMTLATAARPVRDSMGVFTADRGGIRYVPPPQISDVAATARVVADGVTVSGSPTVTSATAAFQSTDVGGTISGTGIPANSTILVVTNSTTVTISANATASATGVSVTITRPGPIGYIPMATNAAALGGSTAQQVAAYKPCMHVTCPAAVEILVAALSRCVEFDNFGARAYPEQVQAWLTIALAQWARRSETALLDRMKSSATQVTAGLVTGAARQLVAQVVRAGAYFRNRNRMQRDIPLHVWFPAWTIDLAICDLVLSSGFEVEFYSMARTLFETALREANINVSWYVDSATGNGQLINAGARQASGALTAFPGTCVWYMGAEGSWLFLDGGSLDLGLVRDSSLNTSNNYRIFGETWEEAALIGPEFLEVTSTVVAGAGNGVTTNAVLASF
jgi:hypothetical protein